jgi:hypothetical protein
MILEDILQFCLTLSSTKKSSPSGQVQETPTFCFALLSVVGLAFRASVLRKDQYYSLISQYSQKIEYSLKIVMLYSSRSCFGVFCENWANYDELNDFGENSLWDCLDLP